jgi:M6 family metalloprotease-like protein
MVQAALFDGPSPNGTLTEAYLEMSRGALAVRGDVWPWVRTSRVLADVVGTSHGLGNDGELGAHLREALDSLDADVDFAAYDNDGPDGIANSGDDDGYVDVVTFEYLEVSASCGGPAIWPHRWTMSARIGGPYLTDDVSIDREPIRIDDYITQSATDCEGLSVQHASTMAHELGHALGLQDYYHWIDRSAGARGRRWVLGCWELMAAGSWGCGPAEDPRADFGPTHLSAHSKHRLGWIDYIEVGEVWNEEVVLDPVQTSGLALRIPLDAEGREFLIAEHRAQTGFDAQLPASGVLFYKQDLTASLQPDPESGDPYFLTLLEHDDDRGLLRTDAEGGDRGVATDAWGAAGTAGALHAASRPPLRLSAGGATSVTVHEVSVVGSRARLVVSTSPTPRLVAPGSPAALPVSLRVAGGVIPYRASWYGPEGLAVTLDGDELRLAGSPDMGLPELVVAVHDAVGTASRPLVVSPSGYAEWTIDVPELLRPILELDGEPLSDVQLGFLDELGNRNGRYDVGDLRRWLRENPAG